MFRTIWKLSKLNRSGFFPLMIVFLCSSNIFAGGKIGVYGLYMVPDGADAENYSRLGFGLGVHIVAPVPKLHNILAVTGGFDWINLLSETTEFQDKTTRLRVERQTSQDYFRLFIGGQAGGHGRGFLRPHAGINIALVYYNISTDVVIPDDYEREEELRQNLKSKGHLTFGYDITLGLDLNFYNKWNLDGGVRYLKSFSLPQQLGEDSENIYPQYFQIYLSIGLSFRTFREGTVNGD